MRGQLIRAGQDPAGLAVPDLLDFTVTLIVDGACAAMPKHSLEQVLELCRDIWSRPPWPDREFFGTGREAQRGAAAMSDLAGGPARRRDS